MNTIMMLKTVIGVAMLAQTTRPAAPPNLVDSPPITVFRDAGRYVSFPDVKRLPDGRLLCVFRDATYPERVRHIEADARIVGSISKDDGRTWSPPFVIFDDEACQNDPCVAVLKDGRLLLTWFNWVGRSAGYVKEHNPSYVYKVDHGKWGEYAEPGGVHCLWGRADTLEWDKQPIMLAGPPQPLFAASASTLEMSNGDLLVPIYGRSTKTRDDQAFLVRSSDGGETWSKPQMFAQDPAGKIAMQEPALVEPKPGHLLAVMRTANAEDHLYCARSADGGKTWTPAERMPVVGHPPDLLLLPDKRVLLAYGYRHQPFGVRMCISDDSGKTWDLKEEMTVTSSGSGTDLGYPSVCLTGDKHVVIVYYMNGPDKKDRWIECKRIPLDDLK